MSAITALRFALVKMSGTSRGGYAPGRLAHRARDGIGKLATRGL
jgi:hypothetical protein